MQRALLGLLLCIVVLDLAQPVFLAWRPKFYGALAGAAIYAACGVGVRRQWVPVLWVVALMPVIPVSALILAALGLSPVAPDAAMWTVLGFQLAAAGLALRLWFSAPEATQAPVDPGRP